VTSCPAATALRCTPRVREPPAPPGRGPVGVDLDTAAILNTSGSTGMPKGVVLSHRNRIVGAENVSTYLQNSPEDVMKLCARHRVTGLTCVPPLWIELVGLDAGRAGGQPALAGAHRVPSGRAERDEAQLRDEDQSDAGGGPASGWPGRAIDVASGGELDIALDTPIRPAQVSFAGPGKTMAEVRRAVAAGVTVELESALEARRLVEAANAWA
jgi:AMP-binding enzyme/Pyridoxal-dependent decarboxylase, pyridoxal binding domain